MFFGSQSPRDLGSSSGRRSPRGKGSLWDRESLAVRESAACDAVAREARDVAACDAEAREPVAREAAVREAACDVLARVA